MKAGAGVTQQVQQRVQDGVTVLTLDRPPGNALVPALRSELREVLRAALADPAIRAVVLHGAGSGFCAGVDLNEFTADEDGPRVPLNDLFAAIEEAPKPVVAALHGSALGAGVELTLAAHARVAQRGTRISMPEVTLGLVPGGGATQRLPRLAGAQASLELMLSGRAVEVTDARLARVFDRITEDDPLAAAQELAASLADSASWTRTRDVTRGLSNPAAFQAAVGNVAARMRAGGSAEADILACVEAAQLLPFDQGLIFEQSRHEERLALPESRAIRHVFTAERRAASLPRTAAGDVPVIRTVALTGTGPKLAGLAALCLSAGMDVLLLTATPDQAAAVRDTLETALAEAVEGGRLAPGARDDQLSRLVPLERPEGLARADLVLDTGTPAFERPVALPSSLIWGLLDEATGAEGRAREAGAAGRLLRLRLPTGGPAVRLAEVAAPPEAPRALSWAVHRAFSTASRSVLLSSEATGFLSDAMGAALFGAALTLLAGGVPPAQVEAAGRTLGFARGPLRLIDELGAVPTLRRLRRTFEARQVPEGPLRLLSDRLADHGGDTARALAFHGPAGQTLAPDPGLADWLAAWRAEHPDHAPGWPGVDPALAMHAAMVNEGARLIAARALQRRSDPDLVMIRGFGMERTSGGPLLQADLNGLLAPMRAMATLRGVNAALWAPSPLLDDMLKNGERFF